MNTVALDNVPRFGARFNVTIPKQKANGAPNKGSQNGASVNYRGDYARFLNEYLQEKLSNQIGRDERKGIAYFGTVREVVEPGNTRGEVCMNLVVADAFKDNMRYLLEREAPEAYAKRKIKSGVSAQAPEVHIIDTQTVHPKPNDITRERIDIEQRILQQKSNLKRRGYTLDASSRQVFYGNGFDQQSLQETY